MRQKGFIPLIIILVIAILGVVGYFAYSSFKGKPGLTTNLPFQTPTGTPSKSDSNPATPYYNISPTSSLKPSVDKSGIKLYLFVDLMVHSNDTVTENAPITIGKGRPPIERRGDQYGDYLLRILDKVDRSPTGSALWSEPFNVYFDYSGPVFMGVDYSEIKYTQVGVSFQIPYESRMKSIQLWHKDKLIYFKELPSNTVILRLPAENGKILEYKETITFGDSAFSLLRRVTERENIRIDYYKNEVGFLNINQIGQVGGMIMDCSLELLINNKEVLKSPDEYFLQSGDEIQWVFKCAYM